MQDGIMEVDYLFRAITKKSSNVLRITRSGRAVWDQIEPSDLLTWQLSMTLWGWGGNFAIPWRDDLDKMLLRASIRLYAIHQDGPITRAMTKGALLRRAQLERIVKKAMKSPKWGAVGLSDADALTRFKGVEHLSEEERHRLGPDIRSFIDAFYEMQWKHKASARIYKWLMRKGRIPLVTVQDWLLAWQYDYFKEPEETPVKDAASE